MVDEVRVPMGHNIKYLSRTLDRRWNFVEHFDKLAPRLGDRTNALLGLMPNFRGPNASVRRMYMHAVLSGTYYRVPVWSGKALTSRRIKDRLHNVQWRLAIKICRAYRMMSYAAAVVLTGILPAEYVADALAETYAMVKVIRLRRGGGNRNPGDQLRRKARRRVFRE